MQGRINNDIFIGALFGFGLSQVLPMLDFLGIPDDADRMRLLIHGSIMFGCFAIALLWMFWSRLFDPEERLIRDQDPALRAKKKLKKGLKWVRKSSFMEEPTITDAEQAAFRTQLGFPLNRRRKLRNRLTRLVNDGKVPVFLYMFLMRLLGFRVKRK